MSGGYWNYEDQRIGDFAERLLEDDDALVRALGQHLADLGRVLHDIDWQRSGDTSSWDRAALHRLLPPGAAVEAARLHAVAAVEALTAAIKEASTPFRG